MTPCTHIYAFQQESLLKIQRHEFDFYPEGTLHKNVTCEKFPSRAISDWKIRKLLNQNQAHDVPDQEVQFDSK
jgi:hypothetical protein